MALLGEDIKAGNAFLRDRAKASAGKLTSGTTVLAVRGLKAAQFVQWLESRFSDENILLAGEPEHYVIAPNPDSTVTIVENFGPHVCRVVLPGFGTVVGRVLTQFGDTADGFNANLTCYFPAACPEAIVEQHRQHLAVEFRNWIVAAADARR